MSDVFVSYAREDRERARLVGTALAARGYSVWWDREIGPGRVFDDVIEHELETANRVVVLWSERSVVSEWVKNEAAAAVDRGVLVPVLIDPVKVPLAFRRRQTINLVGWNGSEITEGFQDLCRVIESKDVKSFGPRKDQIVENSWASTSPKTIASMTQVRRHPWIVSCLAMILVAIGVLWLGASHPTGNVAPEIKSRPVDDPSVTVAIADTTLATTTSKSEPPKVPSVGMAGPAAGSPNAIVNEDCPEVTFTDFSKVPAESKIVRLCAP